MQRWKKTTAAVLLMGGTAFLLFAGESYGVTAETFSDSAFYDCVRIYDRNGDGVLSPEERAEVAVLNVSGKGIGSLDGIESFPALRELYCYDNALDSLDVSRNSQLQILDRTNNRLKVLDLTANGELGQLYCRNNPLSEIVMTNGQPLAALEHDAGVSVSTGQNETVETGSGNEGSVEVGSNENDDGEKGNDASANETGNPESGSPADGKRPGSSSAAGDSSGTVGNAAVADAAVIVDERPAGQAVYQRASAVCRMDRHEAYLPGYADGTFRPEAGISRGDLAAILYGTLTDAEKQRLKEAAAAVTFPDVEAGAWYGEAARTMTAAGIIEVKPDGRLEPTVPVTRGELAKGLDRFAAGSSGAVDYPDIRGHETQDSIRRVAARGWMGADGDGKFYPDRPVTRAETAAAMNRMLERSGVSCAAVRPSTAYVDVAPTHWAYSDILEASVSHTPDGEEQKYIVNENKEERDAQR